MAIRTRYQHSEVRNTRKRSAGAAISETDPKGTTSRKRSRATIWFVLPLAALWAIPVIIFVALVPLSRSQESIALTAKAPEAVRIGSHLDAGRQGVDVKVLESSAAQVDSSMSGVVTAVSVTAGAQLTNGAPLVSINGTPVLAFIEPFPLYRSLSTGATGADVNELAAYLSSVGVMPPQPTATRYNSAIAAGVSAFEKKIGMAPDGTFQPQYVAWVPPQAVAIKTVKVDVGDSVQPGVPIAEGSSIPQNVQFSVTGTDGETPTFPAAGKLRLTAGQSHIDIDSLQLTQEARTAVDGFLAASSASGAISSNQAAGSTTYSGAVLSLASPEKVGVVPSSAIFSTSAGKACIFVQSGSAVRASPLSKTELINGELGSIAVSSDLIGAKVVRDPPDLSPKVLATCR